MTVCCGVFAMSPTADGRSLDRAVLDGALAVLEPHGSAGVTAVHRTFGPASTSVAAVWSTAAERDWAEGCSAARRPVQVVGDVMLTNRAELCASLGAPSWAPDLELVALAYERWGTDSVGRLCGDYAYALLDERRHGVLLVRDHLGAAPLVVHQADGRVTFGSTALALTGFDHIDGALDEDRIAEVLVLAHDSGRTFVQGVRWLESGTAMWIDVAGPRTWRWWPTEDLSEPRDAGSIEEHAEQLRSVFDTAVAANIDGAARLGAALSGGLDSTAVVATASRGASPPPIITWTARPPSGWVSPDDSPRAADETAQVEALADRYPNLDVRFVESDGNRWFDHDHNLWELGAGPGRNPANGLWINSIHEECAASGVDVLLTGAVGNGAFSADGPGWLVDLARRGRFVEVARETRAWAATDHRSSWRVLRSSLIGPLVPQRLRPHRDALEHQMADWRAASGLRAEHWDELDLAELVPLLVDGRHPVARAADPVRFERSGAQADGAAAVRALWGVVSRDPTGDRRVLETCLPQPQFRRRHRGVDRAVVRRAMADRLPSDIVDRRTRGAQLPDWHARLVEARPMLEAEVEELRDHPLSRQFIDADRLTDLVRQWPDEATLRADAGGTTRAYRLALMRAVNVSRYLRWFETRSRRVAAGGPAVVVDRDAGGVPWR